MKNHPKRINLMLSTRTNNRDLPISNFLHFINLFKKLTKNRKQIEAKLLIQIATIYSRKMCIS